VRDRQPGGGRRQRKTRGGLNFRVVGDSVEVYELDFAAYCLMRELPIADLVEEKDRQNGRKSREAQFNYFIFHFADPDKRIVQLSLDYANSESAKFADCVRRLKKTVRSVPTGE